MSAHLITASCALWSCLAYLDHLSGGWWLMYTSRARANDQEYETYGNTSHAYREAVEPFGEQRSTFSWNVARPYRHVRVVGQSRRGGSYDAS